MSEEGGTRRSSIAELADLIREGDDFVLTTHLTPDGDGLGSEISLFRALTRMGKKVRILNCSGVPEDLRFLTKPGEVITYQRDKHRQGLIEAAHIIAFDLGGATRLGRMEEAVREAKGQRILVDHHVFDGQLFDIGVIDIKASASAEMTADLLSALDVPLDLELAEPLYVGLVQDTGSFNYNSTRSRTHRIAADFMDVGVDPYRIWKKLNCQKPFDRVRLMGENIARIRREEGGRLAFLKIDLDDLKKRRGEVRDAFEVVNHFLTIKGVEVGVLGLQIGSEKSKFSVRATGPHDVCKIAQEFGGGGHRYAAGFTVDGVGIDLAFERVMERMRREFKKPAKENAR